MKDCIERERRIIQHFIEPEAPTIIVDGNDYCLTLSMIREQSTPATCAVICFPDIYESIMRQLGQQFWFLDMIILSCVRMPTNEVWFYRWQDDGIEPQKKLVNVLA